MTSNSTQEKHEFKKYGKTTKIDDNLKLEWGNRKYRCILIPSLIIIILPYK